MSFHPLDPHDLGPDDGDGRGDDSGGVRIRVRTMTRGCTARTQRAVCSLRSPAVYPPPVHPLRFESAARQVSLGEAADWPRAVGFGPGSEVLAATRHDGAIIRLWRIDPASDRAILSGQALPGVAAAFSPEGTMLAVGGDSTVTLGEAAPDRPRQSLRTGDGWTPLTALPRPRRRGAGARRGVPNRSVQVWDLAPNFVKRGPPPRLARRGVKSSRCCSAPHDGRSLATGGLDVGVEAALGPGNGPAVIRRAGRTVLT